MNKSDINRAWTVWCPNGEAHGVHRSREMARHHKRMMDTEAVDDCGHTDHRVAPLFLYTVLLAWATPTRRKG